MITQKCNLVTKSVSKLMDGRVFYVPSYQRGYRWTADEVEDLLDDLLDFARNSQNTNQFYCLQPVVVKQVVDKNTLDKLKEILNRPELTAEPETQPENGAQNTGDIVNNWVWEVIDGQQRLTTLHILFNYLLVQQRYTPQLLQKQRGLVSYTIQYETRSNSAIFLSNLATNPNANQSIPLDIDLSFMKEAYNTIDQWFSQVGPKKYGITTGNLLDYIWGLFDDSKPNTPCIKVIWYEIDAQNTNSIDEFLNLNTGKIGLTDAELVKALFLQDRGPNFAGKISQIAIEWENIENTLSADSFWTFLSSELTEKSNRMEFLLELHLDMDAPKRKLKVDKNKKNYLFNYYYKIFEDLSSKPNAINEIQDLWDSIIDVFRKLEGWYEDPILYNYIGYLSQCKVTVQNVYRTYQQATSKVDIIKNLKILIKQTLKGCKFDETSHNISNKYGDPIVRKCLLLFNVDYLNSQLSSLKQNEQIDKYKDFMSPAFKFPFDLYLSQHWNVEHIDSATTNAMKDIETQKSWIKTAMTDLNLKGKEKQECDKMFASKNYTELIDYLKQIAGEEEDNDKMEIGNLTLLDEKTNKSYGNSLFVSKRKTIFANILKGCFIPSCTQLVFAKTFETSESPLNQWTMSDKNRYAQFITERVKKYL